MAGAPELAEVAKACRGLARLGEVRLSVERGSEAALELRLAEGAAELRLGEGLARSLSESGRSGVYALDLLVAYARGASSPGPRPLRVLGGLYEAYERAQALSGDYWDFSSLEAAVAALGRLPYSEEAELLAMMLRSGTFERFLRRLAESRQAGELGRLAALALGECSAGDALALLRDLEPSRLSGGARRVVASVVAQAAVLGEGWRRMRGLAPRAAGLASGLCELLARGPSEGARAVLAELESMLGRGLVADDFSLFLERLLVPRAGSLPNARSPEELGGAIERETLRAYAAFHDATGARLPLLDTLLRSEFVSRLSYVVAERASTRASELVPLRLCAEPRAWPRGACAFAVVFGTFRGFFRALLWDVGRDAEELELRGLKVVSVVGAMARWLTSEGGALAARRAIVPSREVLDEVDLAPPARVGCCVVLNLPMRGERELHERISRSAESLGSLLVNPYASSLRVDDKALFHELLEAYAELRGARVEAPRYAVVRRGDPPSLARERIAGLAESTGCRAVVVKPAHGTEGLGVRCFGVRGEWLDEAASHAVRLLRFDDVVVEELRGNLLHRGLRFTLRLNVCWTGVGFAVESGYALVAPRPGYAIASVSHGGRIVGINEVLSDLSLEGSGQRYEASEADVQRIADACVGVAEAVNLGLSEADYLKYMGVDVVLEARGDSLVPVVLEANSRPSGLSHSRALGSGEASVMKLLLPYVSRALNRRERQ